MRAEQGKLLRILRIGDTENRAAAGRELTAFYFNGKARAALEDALVKDREPQVRKEIATSLGKTRDARVTTALKTAKAKDPDRSVRQAAYRSLIMIEGY
jgi:HEAT repeat protein